MTKLKFNEYEKKLLTRIATWYFARNKDADMKEILTRDDWTKADMEQVKDMMRLYHQKTGLGNKFWHEVELKIFEKFGDGVKSTDEKAREKRAKEEAKKQKAAERKRKKLEAEAEKKAEEAKKKAEAEAEKKRKAEAAKKKDQFSIGEIFSDLTPE